MIDEIKEGMQFISTPVNMDITKYDKLFIAGNTKNDQVVTVAPAIGDKKALVITMHGEIK